MWLLQVALLFLTACGYHTSMDHPACLSMAVPYVEGDGDGLLTASLASAISKKSNFRIVRYGGQYVLCAKIVCQDTESVGFRYEQDLQGNLGERLVASEELLKVAVEWKVTDAAGKRLLGPCCTEEQLRLDFAPDTSPQNDNTFSLGQLDFAPGAREAARQPTYDHLSAKIADILYAWSLR
jgi:hypothetical protein